MTTMFTQLVHFNRTHLFQGKSDSKPEPTAKTNHESALPPVTPPSPFSLSPTLGVDFDIDMLSPSWEDSSSRSATPVCIPLFTLFPTLSYLTLSNPRLVQTFNFNFGCILLLFFIWHGLQSKELRTKTFIKPEKILEKNIVNV